ncbi:MAG: right-handed parallel beta-helix repeat-containing protein [Nanoarchaeota archaeon]
MAALRPLIALLLSLVLLHSAAAITCGDALANPTTLTADLTCQGDGLTINGAKLDCAGHTIKGTGLGAGITANGLRPELSNCAITGFDTGLILNNTKEAWIAITTISNNNIGIAASHDTATTIVTTKIESNSIGAYLDYSSIDTQSATFSRNINDVMISPAQIGKTPPTTATPRPLNTPQRPTPEQAEIVRVMLKEPTQEILNFARTTPWQATAGLHAVAAGKKATLFKDRTQIDITIRAQKDTKDLKVIEYIPKEIAPSSKTIISSAPKFEVVDEDLTILFRLGDVKAGTEKNITYTIDHRLARDLAVGPFTVISIVEEISPELEGLVALMSVLFAGILAHYQYLRSKSGKSSNVALYTAMYIIALACTTILGYIQATLELPPKPTAYTLAAILLGAIGAIMWETHAIKKELTQKKETPTKSKRKGKKKQEENPE